jgi:hypothetical protein
MFNIGRVPHEPCDTLSPVSSPSDPDTKKLFIMVHDWFYAVDVYDDNHKLIKVGDMEKRFKAVAEDVSTRLGKGEKAVPIGLLSADRRDLWAKVISRFNSTLNRQ